ncbi:MAG: Guanidinopropionase [Gammaproteobacteria bacterium]|nr:Guanidinopropionase [Gammaproteobacteria bacterium]
MRVGMVATATWVVHNGPYCQRMTTATEFPQPVDAALMPRFGAIPTFMRLPCICDPAQLDIALIGVPWDGGTTNRAGARHGPREIRNMSSLMRSTHHVSRISPYRLARCADMGDAPVNPINLMESLAIIERFYQPVRAAGCLPLSAGGDHLITLPIFRAIARGRPVGMIHFDAHSDTWDRYFGDNRYTHGTPFRRAVEEGLLDPGRTVQIGIRGSLYGPEDMAFAERSGMRVIYMEEFTRLGVEGTIAEARRVAGDGPTYISFDVDGLDPAFAPGTGTPEIGGITTREAQAVLRGLRGLNLIGADVVEVAPPFDPSGSTALVGATLMFELLCLLADAVDRRRRARTD